MAAVTYVLGLNMTSRNLGCSALPWAVPPASMPGRPWKKLSVVCAGGFCVRPRSKAAPFKIFPHKVRKPDRICRYRFSKKPAVRSNRQSLFPPPCAGFSRRCRSDRAGRNARNLLESMQPPKHGIIQKTEIIPCHLRCISRNSKPGPWPGSSRYLIGQVPPEQFQGHGGKHFLIFVPVIKPEFKFPGLCHPAGPATPIHTVPTGFSVGPPPGPAIPVVETAQSDSANLLAPAAISMAVDS